MQMFKPTSIEQILHKPNSQETGLPCVPCGGNNELVPASCSAAIRTLRAAAQCFLTFHMRQLSLLLAAFTAVQHPYQVSGA